MSAMEPTAIAKPGAPTSAPIIALVGRPNVGKSTFLARASGRFAESANAPGTTVGTEARRVITAAGPAILVDLPGTLALDDRPLGAAPFWQLLLDAAPDAILVVADAGNLARHLPLALACRDLGLPIVLAANLSDEAAARGVQIDTGALAQLLVAPVHRTVGRDGTGVAPALEDAVRRGRQRVAVRDAGASPRATIPAPVYPPVVEGSVAAETDRRRTSPSLGAAAAPADPLAAFVADGRVSPRGAATIVLAELLAPHRRTVADRWIERVERRHAVAPGLAERIAAASIRPLTGIPLLIGVLVATFGLVMIGGGAAAAGLGSAWNAWASPPIHAVVGALIPVPWLANALLWALDAGLLAMLSVGLPYVLAFYVVIAALEDSGYLASVTVLADRVLGAVGLPGRAAIPLLVATGCNVPAIYATRVLATRRERVIAAFLATLTPCSARSAVVIAALVPFAGPWVALAAFGVVGALTVAAGVGANALLPGRQSPLVLELPPFRRPLLRSVTAKAWFRFRDFVRTATPLMLAGSFVLGLAFESGAVHVVSGMVAPLVHGWLGLPAVAGIALAFSFLRKELALQLLLVLAAAEAAGTATAAAGAPIALDALMAPAQLFVYAIVASVSLPCVATFAALAGELGRRTAIVMSAASIAIALAAGGVLARVVGIA
jgi:ferrous iron transport protein B